jgi:excisionase family DNA binding protein
MPRAAAAPRRRPATQPRQVAVDRVLLTVEEAATAIGVSRSLMFELIAAGEIETVRIGRLRRVRPDALLEYVAALPS